MSPSDAASKPVSINTELAKAYYKPIAALSAELGLDPSAILSTLIKLPEVITPTGETLTDDEWDIFSKIIEEAIADLNDHRLEEGKSLEKDLLLRIGNIQKQQELVLQLEPQRKIKIKEGLVKMLEENAGKENYDANRLEQEIIYYIEKIDITEEQVRLKNHCDYFKTISQKSVLRFKQLAQLRSLQHLLSGFPNCDKPIAHFCFDRTYQFVFDYCFNGSGECNFFAYKCRAFMIYRKHGANSFFIIFF